MNFYGEFPPLRKIPPLVSLLLRNLRSLSDGAAGENFGNLATFSVEFPFRNRDLNTLKPQNFRLRRPRTVNMYPGYSATD